MWPFSSKVSIADSGLLDGFVDFHCHLLPGVDDGVQKISETLSILDLWEQQHVSEVWLTPHIMEDIPNEPDTLNYRVDTFGTGRLPEDKIVEIIREEFDLRPDGIIHMLGLRKPIYRQTSAYGHFGRPDVDLPWEKLDRVESLRVRLAAN